VKRVPEKDVPKAALRIEDPDKQLKNKYLNKFLAQGQFVTEKDFEGKGDLLTPPPGKVGFGLKVDAEKATGGFVLPNSHVDVIWLEDRKDQQKKVSKVVLQDVLVLAVDHATTRPADKAATAPAVANVSTVTVAVTNREADQLGFWQDRGKIWLAIRAPEDEYKYKSEGTDSALDPETIQAIKARDTSVEVLVAAQDLEPGMTLNQREQLKGKRFPRDQAPKNALTWNELQGRTIYQPVHADEIVTRLDLEQPSKDKGTGTDTDPDHRTDAPRPTTKIVIIEGTRAREVDVLDTVKPVKPGQDKGKGKK
jgi:Flp pilus assembly protein CpaB